jgi:hypothetical protein
VEPPIIMTAIEKLALAGEQAGLRVEQMIEMLNKGVTVGGLLCLIELRLNPPMVQPRSSCWIM